MPTYRTDQRPNALSPIPSLKRACSILMRLGARYDIPTGDACALLNEKIGRIEQAMAHERGRGEPRRRSARAHEERDVQRRGTRNKAHVRNNRRNYDDAEDEPS